MSVYLHPTSITNIVNPFSISVLGATLPKPTLVSEVHVKYNAVIYLDLESTLWLIVKVTL